MPKKTREEFLDILNKPRDECDGYELHVRHLWMNREYNRLFQSTGLYFEEIEIKDFWEDLQIRINIHYSEPGAVDKFLKEAHEIFEKAQHKEESSKEEKGGLS